MSPHNADKLGKDAASEYWALQKHLMTVIDEHNLSEGRDFFMRCQIIEKDEQYLIFCDGIPIEGISSTRRHVIQALFDGACSQLGR